MYTVHSTCISQIVCWLDPKEGGLVVVSQQPFTRLHTWSFYNSSTPLLKFSHFSFVNIYLPSIIRKEFHVFLLTCRTWRLILFPETDLVLSLVEQLIKHVTGNNLRCWYICKILQYGDHFILLLKKSSSQIHNLKIKDI